MANKTGADGLVSRTYATLVNGVSQQPPTIRLPSQAEGQVNMVSKVVSGTARRPPTEHVKKITTVAAPAEGYFTHDIQRDADESYWVLVQDGKIRVFDINTGVEGDVNGAGAGGYTHAYLDLQAGATEASQEFAAVSVADYTFIANKGTVVAKSATLSNERPNEFLYFLKQGPGELKDFEIKIGTQARTKTMDGTPSTTVYERISDLLYDTPRLLDETVFTNWEFKEPDLAIDCVYGEQTGATGSPEDVEYFRNTWSNSIQQFVYKSVDSFEKLPAVGEDGFSCKVAGTPGDPADDYYVTYSDADQAWIESAKGGIANDFDASTMPHTLVRTSLVPLEFTFAPATWGSRTVGDDTDTATDPGFVGRTIRDVVFHDNRLGFLSDESVNLSEAGSFFNFWPTSVATLIDSDPIEVASTSNRVALLDHAVPFGGNLTCFSARGGIQAELQSSQDEPLSVANARLPKVGSWASSLRAKPQHIGASVYFFVDRDTATGVMEYGTGTVGKEIDADDVTAHVPTYVPGGAHLVASSSSESMLILSAPSEPNAIYVYSFYRQQGEKKQSAWGKWTFGTTDEILGLSMAGSVVLMLVERDESAGGATRSIHIEKIDLRKLTDGGFPHRIHRDLLVELQGVYVPGTDTTTWTIPYNQASEGGVYNVIQSHADWGAEQGRIVQGTVATVDGVITVDGDYEAATCHVGREMPWEYKFTEAVVEPPSQSSKDAPTPSTQGRLQLRFWKVLFRDSGEFTGYVSIAGHDTHEYEYEWTGAQVGNTLVGPPELQTAHFTFDVGGRSELVQVRIGGSGHLPFVLTGAEWEGTYVTRSTRL